MLTIPVSTHDHVRGPADAPVTLVQYGDYQCPYCAQAHPIVTRALATLAKQDIAVRFVFRNFPLREVHPYALHAAEAAESVAAHTPLAFWAMHDALYEQQPRWATQWRADHADAQLGAIAASVHGDASQVAVDLATDAFAGRIRADFEGGVRSGVNGTPAFFINDRRYDGDWQDEAAFTRHLASVAAAVRRSVIA